MKSNPRYLVIANWKMNPVTSFEAKKLAVSIAKAASRLKRTDVIVAPSFPHLGVMKTGKRLFLGAQDAFPDERGAFTGEVSVAQLADSGVKFVLVGHSERRALGETDEMINRKLKAVLKYQMTPVLCIGERIHDMQGGYLLFLATQIRSALRGVSRADISRVTIAYEPVWAIGKHAAGAMKSNDVHETVLYIQKILSELYGREGAKKVRILYGAAVEAENAPDLIKNGNVQGLLVGHASLSIETLGPILKTVDSF